MLAITLIGGPTALIELGGIRLLTDPTFDGPGEYQLPYTTLTKTSRPALSAQEIGKVDAVLLSHDQHADNLDRSGRAFLTQAERIFTTKAGAERLRARTQGLSPWDDVCLAKANGADLRITATPARHGPAGIEPLSGHVIGFVIEATDQPSIYVTGDTVWYAGVAEVARRFPDIEVVLLFAGAAQTRGPFHLTMDVNDAIETAHAFRKATIVPIHCEGWAHFTQNADDLAGSFKALGIEPRLRLLEPGKPTRLPVPGG